MKTRFFHKALVALAVLAAGLTSCDSDVFNINADPFKDQTYKNDLTAPIAVYIDQQPELSEYAEALRYSGTYNALNQSTAGVSFTALVPDNDAMQEFYARRGVKSLRDLSPEYVKAFVLYHTVADSIPTEQFVTKTSLTNLAGEVMSLSIDAQTAGEATVDSEGRIVKMGVSAYNGKIYVMSKAVTPLVETVYDRVAEASTGTSTVMQKAIEVSGWKKDLSTVADTIVENGKKTVVKRYYTLLNVTDETFAKAGIRSVDDLKSKLGANDTRKVGVDSLLREYVSYHILNNSYRVADFEGEPGSFTTTLLGSTAKNMAMTLDFDGTAMTVGTKFVFNKAGESAAFDELGVDFRAKNGVIHNLTAWLPVWEPAQTEVVWDLAAYPEIKGMVDAEIYQPAEAVSKETNVRISRAACFTYEAGDAGSSNNAYGDIDYVTSKEYKMRNEKNEVVTSTALNNDRVVFNLGYMGWVQMKTPTIVKGKYRVEVTIGYLNTHSFMRTQSDGNGGLLKVTLDDRDDSMVFASPYTQVTGSYAGMYTSTLYDEIEFEETSNHDFKMVIMDPAASSNKNFSVQIDYIRFIPIK